VRLGLTPFVSTYAGASFAGSYILLSAKDLDHRSMNPMQLLMERETADQDWFPRTTAEGHEVLLQLDQILSSQHFRQSKRSAVLLRFLVEKTIKGQESILKERTLGIEVFGRKVDYDTSADPIVRMAAGEIRKRIAQYYHIEGHESELRIDLDPGSYVIHFRTRHRGKIQQNATDPVVLVTPISADVDSFPPRNAVPARTPTEPPATPHRRQRIIVFWAGGIVLAVLALGAALFPKRTSFVARAWGDVLEGTSPVLITVGQSRLYLQANPDTQRPMTTSEHLQTGETLSYSEAQTLVRLVTVLDHRRQFNLVSAGNASFSDMRNGPVILLGGLNNPWTMRAQQALPIRLATDGDGYNWIVDTHQQNDKKWFVDSHRPYSNLTKDYAIVARFYDPNSQEPTLIVAGLGENGTKAAGEFITGDEPIQHLLGDSLKKDKNFEVLLETQVINGASGPPKLLAKEIW